MRYVLVIFLIDINEPVTLECEDDGCDSMFQDIRKNGVTIRHGQRVEYYPPGKIDHIRAKPKRTKLSG